jgi:DNA-binding response OmpR family regulator
MHKILIADGDDALSERIARALREARYQVFISHTAEALFTELESVTPDLLLLDLLLPDSDGLILCRKLRDNPQLSKMPILLLTNQGSKHSVSEALEAGGDDYIRKPFAVRELLARIRANLRWVSTNSNTQRAQIRIFSDSYQVFVNDREISLTRVEYRLLSYLCQNPESWHSTKSLLEFVWRYPGGVGDSALVRNHIRNLRNKIEEFPKRPSIIQSRHGRGYAVQALVHFRTITPR